MAEVDADQRGTANGRKRPHADRIAREIKMARAESGHDHPPAYPHCDDIYDDWTHDVLNAMDRLGLKIARKQ